MIRLAIARTFSEKSKNRASILQELDATVLEFSHSLPDIDPRKLAQIEAAIAYAPTSIVLAEKLRQYEELASCYGDVRLVLERGRAKWEERQALARHQEKERAEFARKTQLEDAEFRELLEEVSAKGFTESRQVSHYIIANKLGSKYRHISGVLEMERGDDAWKYRGGFPPHIYARLCDVLGLNQKTSDAKVAGFKSFRDLNHESRSQE